MLTPKNALTGEVLNVLAPMSDPSEKNRSFRDRPNFQGQRTDQTWEDEDLARDRTLKLEFASDQDPPHRSAA